MVKQFWTVILSGLAFIDASPYPDNKPVMPSSINDCGRTCIDDLLREAQFVMGCDDLKTNCLCNKKNFLFGIRDCSSQACGAKVRGSVLDWYYKDLCINQAKSASAGSASTRSAHSTQTGKPSAASQSSKAAQITSSKEIFKPAATGPGSLDEWGESEPIVTVGAA